MSEAIFNILQTYADGFEAAVTALEPLDTSSSGGGGTSLTISDCEEILSDAHLGDSISVNGTFLNLLLNCSRL